MMNFARPLLVAMSLTAIAAAPLLDPQDPQQPEAARVLVFDVGNLGLRDLVERSAEFLGRRHLYNEADFNIAIAPVVLSEQLTLTRDNCEEVVEALLYTKGFALVPLNPDQGLWDVINMSGQRRQEVAAAAVSMSAEEVLRLRHRKLVVMCLVEVHALNPQHAAQQLRPIASMFSGSSPVGLMIAAAAPGGSVLLRGHADRVALMIDALRGMDTAAAEKAEAEAPEPSAAAQLEALRVQVESLVERVVQLEAGE